MYLFGCRVIPNLGVSVGRSRRVTMIPYRLRYWGDYDPVWVEIGVTAILYRLIGVTLLA